MTSSNPEHEALRAQYQARYDAVLTPLAEELRIFLTKYQELFIDPLTQDQIKEFIGKFCLWKYPTQPKIVRRVAESLDEKQNRRIQDLIKRPVQLMMFLVIFPQLPHKFDKITQGSIYSAFIDELINREKKKVVRRTFDHAQHRRFAQKIAWWLWLRGGQARVEAREIGDDILAEFGDPGEDLEVIRRSLVSASFLGSHGGAFLHFPHRSIQEFFVAEHLASYLRTAGTLARLLNSLKVGLEHILTIEIVDFIAAQCSLAEVEEFTSAIRGFSKIPRSCLNLMGGGEHVRQFIYDQLRRTGNAVCAWMCTYSLLQADEGVDSFTEIDLLRVLRDQIADRGRRLALVDHRSVDRSIIFAEVSAYLICMFALLGARQVSAAPVLDAILYISKFETTMEDGIVRARRGKRIVRRRTIADYLAVHFTERIAANCDPDRIKIDWIYKFLLANFGPSPMIAEWVSNQTIEISGIALPAEIPPASGELRTRLQRITPRS